jgi:uncharacterized small protein (DUF1192 family)
MTLQNKGGQVEEVKEEPETKCGKVKAEEPVIEVKAEEPVIEVKAEKNYDAEIKALQTEIANLKAELAKPVMKALVEEKVPQEKPIMKVVSPLNLLR